MSGTPVYDAFISYSHAADSALAPALRLALHRFAKPWYKTRALSIFLDQSSLSANPALWTAVEKALSRAAHFILLASPQAASSHWVRKEIDWWLTHRSVETMLVLLTDGDLLWDAATDDFDWTRTTALSPELARSFPTEPLWVDLRWAKAEHTLSLRSPRFRSAVLDIAAPLHGRNKDELDGEDIRQNRRTLRLARAGVTLVVLLAAAAVWQAIVATRQRDEAIRQRDLAQSRRLISDASRQLENPLRWNLAMLLAIESMRKAPTADSYEWLTRWSSDGARTVASFPGERIAAFSPDGRSIATRVTNDLVIHEAVGGRELARIDASGSSVATICFTPDSKRVLGHTRDEAMLADVATGRRVPLPGEIQRGDVVEVSRNCRLLAVVHGTRGQLVDLEAGTVVGGFAAPADVRLVAVGHDGDAVAYAHKDRVVIVGARTASVRGEFAAGQGVTKLAFDRDAKRLSVEIGVKGIITLDAHTVQPIGTSAARGELTLDGNLSAVLEKDDRELVIWDVPGGAWKKRVAVPRAATNLVWSDDGEFLAYGGYEGDGSVRVLQSESWRQLARFTFPIDVSSNTPAVSPSAVFVRISPLGNLASAADSRRVAVFEIHHDRPVVTLPAGLRPGPVALSADGRRVAFRTLDHEIAVVDIASGRTLLTEECRTVARSQAPRVSADGRVLAVGCGADAVVLYDVESAREIARLRVPHGTPTVMSRNGDLVFAGSTLVRPSDGHRVRDVTGGRVAALDAEGRRFAASSDGSVIRLYDLRSDAAPRSLDAAISALESLAFSDDGAVLAAGGRDMRVKIFDTSTGATKQILEHLEQDQWMFRIHRLVFSPSGRLMATLADDPTMTDVGRPGTVSIFELAGGRLVARVPFSELAHDLRFAPDESFFEIAVGRRRIRWEQYPLSAEAMIRRACALVHRNMEPIEWSRFMPGEQRRETCPGRSVIGDR